jgi:hypothetical protein
MTAMINKRLGGASGTSGASINIGPYGGPNTGTLSMAQIEQLAGSVGMRDPHLMAAIAMAESGGRVGVINSIGATGLWQILQSAWPQFPVSQLTTARGNALAAKEVLNTQGLGAWEAYTRGMHTQYLSGGGRIPWYGSGTDFMATRPQVIGVGDGGRERVTVTPSGKGTSGTARDIIVRIEKIEYHGEGDIEEVLSREFKKFADDLDDGA